LGALASGRTREVFDRRGRELAGSAAAPGSFTSLPTSLWNEPMILAPPPQTHVRKKLESRCDGTAAFNLNGSRVGELTVFLDRVAALDRGPGKPVEV